MNNNIKLLYIFGLVFISLGILIPVVADSGSTFYGMMTGSMGMNHDNSDHSTMMDGDHDSDMMDMMNEEDCEIYMNDENHTMMDMMNSEECTNEMDQIHEECDTIHQDLSIEDCYAI